MTAFKEWMYQRYEVEAICEYNDLWASGGDFDALPNRRIDTIRRPGDKEQFRRERAADQQRMKSTPGTPGVSLDAERQRLRQAESEERQDYSRRRDEEIRFREGGTPSPITYDSSLPSSHSGSLYEENLVGGVSVQAAKRPPGANSRERS